MYADNPYFTSTLKPPSPVKMRPRRVKKETACGICGQIRFVFVEKRCLCPIDICHRCIRGFEPACPLCGIKFVMVSNKEYYDM